MSRRPGGGSRGRIALGALGAALLLCSTAVALLGRAVLAAPSSVDRTVTVWPARVSTKTHHAGPADSFADSLLGVGGDDAFSRIVAIYSNAVSFLATAGDPKGPIQISQLIDRLHSNDEIAQALTMAGTLLAYSAGAGFGATLPRQFQAPTVVVLNQAVDDFRAAVSRAPDDETAKFDLELILHQLKRPPHSSSRPGHTKKPPKGKGAGRPPKKGSNGQEHHAGIYSVGNGY